MGFDSHTVVRGQAVDNNPEAAKVSLSLYKSLLVNAAMLPDLHARKHFTTAIRSMFRSGRKTELTSAQEDLRKLQKANMGNLKALEEVLEHTYGLRGKRRDVFLKSALPPTPRAAPLVPGDWRTVPPVIPEPFTALAKSQFPKKRIEVVLPIPTDPTKTLTPKREANFRKRHFQELRKKIIAPIPRYLVESIEQRLREPETLIPPLTELQKQRLAKMFRDPDPKATRGTRTLTPRFLSRMYRRLLNEAYILEKDSSTGKWFVARSEERQQAKTFPVGTSDMFEGMDEKGNVISIPTHAPCSPSPTSTLTAPKH
ncbi:hypothetical protein SAICODRAFT_23846 [Saitoella complicata NRRL Y-17804]|nr:uncharacterized protein SAICODRAFT_23846 [Saitoella complicata NRRL Y-17804]ODQ55183.1 hypothetical protein SAICODRAFT_23846 [Saitoella complicata NRRL Y-17804]